MSKAADYENYYVEDPELGDINPAEVPDYVKVAWINSKLLKQAVGYGLVILGRSVKGYMIYAAENMRFECVYVWGFQGSMKSNWTLQSGYWVYEDWDLVLKYLAMRPGKGERGFQAILEKIGAGRRVPWIGWDDLAVNYTAQTYKIDVQQYAAIDALFACARTKASVITCNSPVIERLPKNIKDNASIEVFLGRNQRMMTQRICRIMSHKKMESYFFKVPIEKPYIFDYKAVPSDVWSEYEDLRNRLAEDTIRKLGEAYKNDVGSLDEYMPIYDIIDQGIATPAQIQSYASRDMITMVKVDGKRYVAREDVDKILSKCPKHKPMRASAP
jgi:hypothetical protein